MKKLNFIRPPSPAAGAASITRIDPQSKGWVKVVSVCCTINDAALAGDFVAVVRLTRAGQTGEDVCTQSNPWTAPQTMNFRASIGNQALARTIAAANENAQANLPDIWYDQSLDVTISGSGIGTLTITNVIIIVRYADDAADCD